MTGTDPNVMWEADPMIDKNVCFVHDGEQPVKKMMAIDCDYHIGAFAELVAPAVCDFSLNNGHYAWVDEAS